MNHLPKLSAGVRRAAGVIPATLDARVSGGEQHGFGSQSARLVPASSGLAVYGNWCGPGHSGPEPPIDAVDAVCQAHDRCFDQHGYDCGCNRDLVDAMPDAIARTPSAHGKLAGAGIKAFFQTTPCICTEVCLPFVGCFPVPAPFPEACWV